MAAETHDPPTAVATTPATAESTSQERDRTGRRVVDERAEAKPVSGRSSSLRQLLSLHRVEQTGKRESERENVKVSPLLY